MDIHLMLLMEEKINTLRAELEVWKALKPDQDLRATIEAKDAEIEEAKERLEVQGERINRLAEANGALITTDHKMRADAAEARVKEMEGDLNRLIRHRDGEGGDSGFFQFFDRLVDEDTARTNDRIAALDRQLAEARRDTARLDYLAKIATIRSNVVPSCGWVWQIRIDPKKYGDRGNFRAAIDEAGGE